MKPFHVKIYQRNKEIKGSKSQNMGSSLIAGLLA
jgi:hypothetical protein